MKITEEKEIGGQVFFAVRCGNCGELCGDDIFFWDYKYFAMDSAIDSGWWLSPKGAYCPACYRVNDNDEMEIIKGEFS